MEYPHQCSRADSRLLRGMGGVDRPNALETSRNTSVLCVGGTRSPGGALGILFGLAMLMPLPELGAAAAAALAVAGDRGAGGLGGDSGADGDVAAGSRSAASFDRNDIALAVLMPVSFNASNKSPPCSSATMSLPSRPVCWMEGWKDGRVEVEREWKCLD